MLVSRTNNMKKKTKKRKTKAKPKPKTRKKVLTKDDRKEVQDMFRESLTFD